MCGTYTVPRAVSIKPRVDPLMQRARAGSYPQHLYQIFLLFTKSVTGATVAVVRSHQRPNSEQARAFDSPIHVSTPTTSPGIEMPPPLLSPTPLEGTLLCLHRRPAATTKSVGSSSTTYGGTNQLVPPKLHVSPSRFIMNPVSNGLLKGLRRVLEQQRKSFDFCRQSRAWSSTVSFSDLDEKDGMEYDNDSDSKRELEPQGVDPKKGWGFRGVHRAIICGKVGQVPLQKILRSGRTITTFTVGTGGMFDQRVVGPADLPKPAQWHRIVVHNDHLGAYAAQKLVKNAAVYVEGDIETRVYNDSIDDQVRSIPEICVRRDGKIRLVKSGDSAAGISLDELREGLF